MIKIQKRSQFSGNVNSMELNVTMEQLEKYERGEGLVQNIFPNLGPDEREFLMTGATPQEWESMFG